MSTIVTRAGKGSPLTNTELDSNFSNLNTDKAELSGSTFTGNLSLGDNVKLQLGNQTNGDLQIYHDGSHSYVSEQGTGNLRIYANDLVLANNDGSQTFLYGQNGGPVSLSYANNAKLATTTTGIDVTGVITTDGMTTSADINFGDNDKAVFGASSDLQIYHDGSNSHITDAGTGNLILQATDFVLKSGGTGAYIEAASGVTKLYHSNALKLATTSTGIDVTGSVVADGLTVQSTSASATVASFKGSTGFGLKFFVSAVAPYVQNIGTAAGEEISLSPGGVRTALFQDGGDISFYEDTGTTPKFFWDSSKESLAIGTTSLTPTDGSNIELSSSTSSRIILDSTGTGGRKYTMASGTAGSLDFYDYDASAYRLRINADGSSVFSGAVTAGGHIITNTSSRIENQRISMEADGTLDWGSSKQYGTLTWDTNKAIIVGQQSSSLEFRTNGTGVAMTMDTSQNVNIPNGKLGIGLTSVPSAALHTSGNVAAGKFESTSSTYVDIDNGTVTGRLQTISSVFNIGTATAGTSLALKSGNGVEAMRIDGSQNVLISTTDTAVGAGDTNTGISLQAAGRGFFSIASDYAGRFNRNTSDGDLVTFAKDGSTVGSIGTYGSDLVITSSVSGHKGLRFGLNHIAPIDTSYSYTDATTDLGLSDVRFKDLYLSGTAKSQAAELEDIKAKDTNGLNLQTSNGQKRVILDNSGNLLVGKTSLDFGATSGQEFRADGRVFIGHSGAGHFVNRIGSAGSISEYRQDGTPVGSWKSRAGVVSTIVLNPASGNGAGLSGGTKCIVPADEAGIIDNDISLGISTHRFRDLHLSGTVNAPYIGATDTGIYFNGSFNAVVPYRPDTGVAVDDYLDLGVYSHRWDDIFATNGTIQTSDRNEKQDIESLTEAEERVAVAAKGLLKKFRWKSAVEDKGDDARIHFGIIAQDLQDAFEAEGLDAGRYGMFTSNTWTNEDGEEQTRMGVRYSELLAFIISAI